MVGTIVLCMGVHSAMNIQSTKQIGRGAQLAGVIIILTRRMGKRLMYGVPAHYIVSSWRSVWEACSSMAGTPVPQIYSLVIQLCTLATFSR